MEVHPFVAGQTDIWAGLVVEVTRRIERALPAAQRLSLAWRYNLRTRSQARPLPPGNTL